MPYNVQPDPERDEQRREIKEQKSIYNAQIRKDNPEVFMDEDALPITVVCLNVHDCTYPDCFCIDHGKTC